jgi:hypothetical protein
MQITTFLRHTILSSVACLALSYFLPLYLINGTILGKNFIKHKICFPIFSETFLNPKDLNEIVA